MCVKICIVEINLKTLEKKTFIKKSLYMVKDKPCTNRNNFWALVFITNDLGKKQASRAYKVRQLKRFKLLFIIGLHG